jgi:hypothetical protein
MRTSPAFVALAVLLAPELAQACSVCFSGQDQSRTAFIVTTAFLSILPLAFIAGMALWIRSHARALEARRGDPVHGLRTHEPWKRIQ